MENQDNVLKKIKKDFFTFRNGIIAESLKKIYPENTLIFGLMLPQLKVIAEKYPQDVNMGLMLWQDSKCRESRLLSFYIIPPDQLPKETAIQMINEVKSSEEAELLAFKLLKNLPYSNDLIKEFILKDNKDKIPAYCQEMLKKNLSLT